MFSVLVVEDDNNLRKLMCAALKQHGYNPRPAADAYEALDEMDKYAVDLVISDIMMPKMNGYELTKSLRDAGFDMPVLMVTAKETFEDKQNGFMAGADDYRLSAARSAPGSQGPWRGSAAPHTRRLTPWAPSSCLTHVASLALSSPAETCAAGWGLPLRS